MIDWSDVSDRRSRFFEGQIRADTEPSLCEVVKCMFEFLMHNIIGHGNAVGFEVIMFKVNCDTGRIIAVATTEEGRMKGVGDGCSVRVQNLQDYWYDLDDIGINDKDFSLAVSTKVFEIGQAFRELLLDSLADLRDRSSRSGFRYILLGTDPSNILLDERFS